MILRNVSALVFAETDAQAAAAEAAAGDPRMARASLEVHRGGVLAAAAWLAEHPSPDVLLVADNLDAQCWERMEKLADNVETHCRVIVLGPVDSIATFRDMTARGIADYLGGEIEGSEIVDAIARQFVAEEGLPKGRMVAVVSAVGGAGGSTVAAILAANLSARMGDAILVDMDLACGTAALLMGIDPRDALASAMANPGLDAAMLERFLAREGKVRVLSTAGALKDARYVDGDGIERVTSVARAMAKVVVVDMPRCWGESFERLTMLADEVVVVARPDLASLRNCRMIVDDVAGRRIDGRRPKIVLNGAGVAKKNEYGTADFAESGGAMPAAQIPYDPEPLLAAISEGKAIHQAGGKVVAALTAFASTILAVDGGKPEAAKAKAVKSADPLASLLAKMNGLMAKKKG